MRRLSSVVIVTAILGSSQTTTAQAEPFRDETLQMLLAHADRAMNAKHYSEAVSSLKAAYSIEPSEGTACNLGLAAKMGGDLPTAATFLARCSTAPFKGTREEQTKRAGVLANLAVARQEVATLVIRAVPEGSAEITIDGQPADLVDGKVYVAPGLRAVTAKRGGMVVTQKVQAVKGKSEQVELSFAPPVPAPATARVKPPIKPAAPPAEDDERLDVPLCIGKSVTSVALLTAASTAVGAMILWEESKEKLIEAKDAQPASCAIDTHPACAEYVSKGDTSILLRDVAIGAAIGAGVAGLVTTIYAISTGKTRADAVDAGRAGGVVIRW